MGRRMDGSKTPIQLPGCIGALVAVSLLAAAPPVAASDFDIVLSEVHYHPFGDADPKFEFVEIHNGGVAPVDLGGWSFTEGIDFVIPSGTVLEPGAFLAVSPNAAALRSVHPSAAVIGDYSGRLDNGGEIVVLSNPSGRTVSRVHYRDEGAWSSLADGKGASLELLILHGDVDRPAVWAPSRRLGGTPGWPNTRDAGEFPHSGKDPAPLLRLNEVKSAAVDGAGFVELWNGRLEDASLGGHRLLESSGQAYTFPAGMRIPAGGFLVVPTETLGFAPSGESSEWLLLAADGETILDAFEARPTAAGYGTGRHPDGGKDGFVMPPSPGTPNLFQADERVVINEIFYAARFEEPSGNCFQDCSDRRQWIELHNRSGSDVDLGGWTLDDGVGYTFPPGTRLLAGELLVVAASRAAFLEDHPGVEPAPGEWSGRLGRREDTIVLRDALGNAADSVHYGNGDPYNDVAPEDGRDDRTVTSSDWPTDVSDTGRSIELLHPFLENEAGRAWRRGPVGGTPGLRNSVFDDDDPLPVAFGVLHFPAVPRSTEPVLVTCRAHAVNSIQSVELEWRIEGEGEESIVPLRDDGAGGDGIAGDSVFSGRVPPVPDGSIVAFRVILTSASGKEDVYPPRPASGNRTPFYLYQVDDSPSLHNGSVDYRVIMSRADLNTLRSRPETSDVLLNATFIGDGEVHHMVVIRYRGENSRRLPRKAYRIAFPPEDTFQDMQVLNLQPSNRDGGIDVTGLQEFLSADLFRRQGIPYPQEWPVNLHFAGGVLGDLEGRLDVDPMYVRKEHMNREFLDRYFGGSDGGNLYRALDPPGAGPQGDLSYRGDDPEDYVEIYEKRSNRDENDYSDIIELTRAFDSAMTPNARFESEMLRLIDVEQWASFFAIQDFITNIDGGIQTQTGEDYFLYRVPDESARPDVGLWLILPWDIEETFSDPNVGLFLPAVAASRRFLRHQAFAPLYLAALNDLRSGAGSRREMRKSYAYAHDIYPAAIAGRVTADLDTYVTRRNQVVGDQIASGIEAAIRSGPPGGTKVIQEGDTWAYWKGVQEPSDGTLDWSSAGFDDASWPRGPSGFGYGDGDDATVLDDMEAGNGNVGYLSLYIRRTFDVPDPAALGSLSLVVDYDDAFVAYLNGVEAARSPGMAGAGAVGEPVPFDLLLGDGTNHEASRGGNNPNPPETFALDDVRGILVPGQNVLAIHGLNSTRDSSDFSLIPELVRFEADSVPGGGRGREIFAGGASADLEGIANPAITRSVKV
ncbi:MAG TPA: lamin tail domain-containing protein, partial [Planctomycetota bacterium]|nr:lamin tail domain-containing protein [Planctomycetota bacterium]